MKQFTKITALGLVLALALGTANCKKDEKDDTATMLLLLALLNQNNCGKPSYSGGYFLNQVAPSTSLRGVGSYPWDYNTCKPLSSVNTSTDSATTEALGSSTTGAVYVKTVFTYDTNNRLSKRETTTMYAMPASTLGTNGYRLHSATSFAACPENTSATATKDTEAIKTTNYTRDASGNVTREETTFTCGGQTVKKQGAAYLKKEYTYNADNRVLTLKAYVNYDTTYTSVGGANTDFNNSSSANPLATVTYTYTPSSGIPTSVKMSADTFYLKIKNAGSASQVNNVDTNKVDTIEYTVGMLNGKLTSASGTVTCATHSTSDATLMYSATLANNLSGNTCGGTVTSGSSYSATTAGYESQTLTYTATHLTQNTDLLSTLKEVKSYKDSTGNTSTTVTTTNTYFYNEDWRLSRVDTLTTTVNTTSGVSTTTISDSRPANVYSYEGGYLKTAGSESFSMKNTSGTSSSVYHSVK